MVPVVLGHKQRLYLVDHHHLALALHEEGVKHVLTSIVADLSHLDRQEFWSVMDHRNFVYPFDVDGVRHPIENLPKRIVDLKDDPFRALAGAVRDAGGFAKIDAPFSEFLWADFLRRRVGGKKLRHSFEDAVEEAMQLARSRDARHLRMVWSGPMTTLPSLFRLMAAAIAVFVWARRACLRRNCRRQRDRPLRNRRQSRKSTSCYSFWDRTMFVPFSHRSLRPPAQSSRQN